MIGNKQDKSRTKIIKLYLAPLKLIDKGLSLAKYITLTIFYLMESVGNRKISDINLFHFFSNNFEVIKLSIALLKFQTLYGLCAQYLF